MKKHVGFAALVSIVALAIVAAGCASTNGNSIKSFNIKDQVVVGNSIWKVLAVEKMKETTAGAKADGEFVFIQMELKNSSNEGINLTGIEVELVDANNMTYNFDAQQNTSFLSSLGKDTLIKGRVEPGETVSGWVAFDISETAKEVKMRVRDLDVTSSKSALINLNI